MVLDFEKSDHYLKNEMLNNEKLLAYHTMKYAYDI